MFLLLSALLACSSSKDVDSGTDTDTTDTSDSADTAALTCDPVAPTDPSFAACAAAGGICVGQGECTGTHLSDQDTDCAFDDGPGDCCAPPAAAASGDTCTEMGGVCAPVGGCYGSDGWSTESSDCSDVNRVCCVPEDSCEGQDVLTCCYVDPESGVPMTQYRAHCNRGEVECPINGTALTCVEDCPVR